MKPLAKQLEETPIAIVGMAGLFPKAKNLSEYWNNILNKIDCISDITTRDGESYWNLEEYFTSGFSNEDKTYSRVAGFIPEIELDCLKFGIPPKSVEAISAPQLYALYVAEQALADAGLLIHQSSDKQRSRTNVVLGSGGFGNTGVQAIKKSESPKLAKVLQTYGFKEELINDITHSYRDLYADWQEGTFPGYLPNIVAGRIANRFDLGGTNYTVDAACAASLAAIKASIYELLDGSCDAILTGGVNIENSILSFLSFSKIRALSKKGNCSAFDQAADGLVLGDCCGMMVLKRLEDAERDGNTIYSIIKSIGSSNDGKANSIYSPRLEGQIKCIERAYENCSFDPKDISYLEAHGTGTGIGDPTELKSSSKVYQSAGVPLKSIALGSVKSQIGHSRLAAGAAAIIKTSLALHHKILPPTIHVDNPISELEESTFYLNLEARPWIPSAKKRMAAVNAFGFGGTNFHMVLEEYTSEQTQEYRIHGHYKKVMFHAQTEEELQKQIAELKSQLDTVNVTEYFDKIKNEVKRPPEDHPRLGFVANSGENLLEKLVIALQELEKRKGASSWEMNNIYFRTKGLKQTTKTVALFPGQGAQKLYMGNSLACAFPEFRKALNHFEKCRLDYQQPSLTDVIYPALKLAREQKQQQKILTQTDNAQPALGVVSLGMLNILETTGFKANMSIGHSYGELLALYYAGVIDEDTLIKLSIARGSKMMEALEQDGASAMLAVGASEEAIRKQCDYSSLSGIHLTNHNSTKQTVFGGEVKAIEDFKKELAQKSIVSTIIPTAGAFHTPYVQSAGVAFSKELKSHTFKSPKIKVWANATAKIYPEKETEIRKVLSKQITQTVHFKQSIEEAYKQGGRVFIEIGHGNTLSSFVRDILKDKEHYVVALGSKSVNDHYSMVIGILQMQILGLDLKPEDHYPMVLSKEKMSEKSGLLAKMDGGIYLSPASIERKQKALQQPKTIDHQSLAVSKPIVSVNQEKKEMEATKDDSAFGAMNNLHREFIQGQQEYLKILQQMVNHENPSLLQKLQQSNAEFHASHREYLNQQSSLLSLMSGQPMNQGEIENYTNLPAKGGEIERIQEKAFHAVDSMSESNSELNIEEVNGISVKAIEQTAFDPLQFEKKLLEVISSSTGFPIEMIHPNIDMEAELGIDSIKRIEILSLISEEYPQLDLETLDVNLGEIKTPQQIADTFKAIFQHSGQDNNVLQTKETDDKIDSTLKETAKTNQYEEITDRLFMALEEVGYPRESIDLDMDLEADLGLDSINRLQMLSQIESLLPSEEEVDYAELGNLRTLRQIIDFVTGGDSEKNNLPDETNKIALPEKLSLPKEGISVQKNKKELAQVLKLDTLDLELLEDVNGEITLLEPHKAWLINCDEEGICFKLAEKLKEKNQEIILFSTVLIDKEKWGKQAQGVIRIKAGSNALMEKEIEQLFAQKTSVGGVCWIHASSKNLVSLNSSLGKTAYQDIRLPYLLARKLGMTHKEAPEKERLSFISISQLNGKLGLHLEKALNFTGAGLAGLTKALSKEWNQAFCKHIDLASEMSIEEKVDCVIEELHGEKIHRTEVGRNSIDKRWALKRNSFEWKSDENYPLFTENDVALISGGGKGITYSCAQELVNQGLKKIILLGRTPIDEKPAWLKESSAINNDKLLFAEAAAFLSTGSGKTEPLKVKQLVEKYKKQLKLSTNIEHLEKMGATVHYIGVDIVDKKELKTQLKEIQEKTGAVSVMVHGAGNIADKWIEDKSLKDFELVLDTKLKGLEALLHSVEPKKLKKMVLFSSISAFFGNAGQTDYALANEMLNKAILSLKHKYPHIHMSALGWGAWNGGMVNNVLAKMYQQNGVDLIEQKAGSEFFVDYIKSDMKELTVLVNAPDELPQFNLN